MKTFSKALAVIFICISCKTFSQLSGNYTIGTGGNYATINSAVTALESNGVNGPVIFNILPGNYPEQVAIDSIPGSSSVNNITFQSSTLDTNDITWYAAATTPAYILRINGADFITFRKLRFVGNLNKRTKNIIDIFPNSTNVRFVNNAIRQNLGSSSNNFVAIEAIGKSITGLDIDSNNFTSFGDSPSPNHFAIYGDTCSDISIVNNIFSSFSNSVILNNIDSPLIERNVFNMTGNSGSHSSLTLNNCINSIKISKNSFVSSLPFFPNGPTGISLEMTDCNGNSAYVSNNFFRSFHFNKDIQIINSSNINVCFNSLHAGGRSCYNLVIANCSNILVKNNLILHLDTYPSGISYTLNNLNNTIVNSDFNNFWCPFQSIAVYNGVYASTLPQMMQISGRDSNSMNQNVYFFNGLRLNPNVLSNANLIGTPISGITDDIDGNLRDAYAPIMGAHEPVFPIIKLNLDALLQGFYNEQSGIMIAESLTVLLRQSIAPYNISDSAKAFYNSGKWNLRFLNAPSGDYYIVLKHRNSLETWSKNAQTFQTGQSYSYDFTSSQSLAYGDNMILKGTKYCIYSGDVNQDGLVDLTDINLVYNDAAGFNSGYIETDLTGDNTVDLSDLTLAFNNSNIFVSVQNP